LIIPPEALILYFIDMMKCIELI